MENRKDEMKRIFSHNLKRIMEEKELRQFDVAKFAGVSEAAVSYWVSGQMIPRMDKIKNIADGIGISITELIDEKKEYNPIPKSHLKYILFGDDSISDDKLNQVLKYAEFIKGE